MIIGFAAGLLILSIAIVLARKNRYEAKKRIGWITGGVFLAIIVMILPTRWLHEGQSISSPFVYVVYSIVSALDYSFKAFAGQPELIQVESSTLEGCLRSVIAIITLVLLFVAPILASSFIASFIGDTMDRFHYWLRYKPKCCVFSELNENSLTLAQSLKENNTNQTIVFCGVSKETDETLAERARKLGGILLNKPCTVLLPFRQRRIVQISWKRIEKIIIAYELYLIAEDKDKNVNVAENVIQKIEAMTEVNVKTIVFTQDRMSITILEEAVNRTVEELSKRKEDTTAGGKFRMEFVDEIALFCSNLVFRHPLYDLPDNRRNISVMIVGCGWYGTEMLKTVLSNGIISGYSLKICVYDRNAEQLEGKFYCQCPGVKKLVADDPNVQLSFIQTDVSTSDFFEKIEKDATYVCVATDSDAVNLTTAENLYRYFRRQNGFSYTPPIFVRVKNGLLAENVSDKDNTYLQKRKIELFGTAKSFYGNTALFNTTLERLALGLQLTYEKITSEQCWLDCYLKHVDSKDETQEETTWNEAAFNKVVDSFYSSEYSRRSSMASVLHFGAKLIAVCGISTKCGEVSEEQLEQYQNAIQDPQVLERLMRNEHDRWNFYMATEGWQSVTIDEMKKYCRTNGSHKDKLSKSHPCLIPFNKLDALSDAYNDFSNQNEDFRKEDEKIIQRLPQIVRFANRYYTET